MQWEKGCEILPSLEISGGKVSISNVRDFSYDRKKIVTEKYTQRVIDVNTIKKVHFNLMPFSRFPGVAHSYFTFDFSNQDPIVLSVEARKRLGEGYSPIKGLFPHYPLMYSWTEESDETVKRALFFNKDVYMFPLIITDEMAKALFLQLAHETIRLITHPRYYNTIFSNCTNELAKCVNKIKPGAIPPDLGLYLPGFAPKLLHHLGYIPNNEPLEVIKDKYNITELVRKYNNTPNFSDNLRLDLAA